MVGAFGGASRSLFEIVRAFPPGRVEPAFIVPRGTAAAFFARLGTVIEARGLTQFDDTRYSHYRGLRWLVLLRELAFLPSTVLALRRARKLLPEIDLIHINEITGVVVLWLVRRWFTAPAIMHVRAVTRVAPEARRTRWVARTLMHRASAVIAIDDTVRASLAADLPVEVIHNAFAATLSAGHDAALERSLAAMRSTSFKVGFVGNLLRVKGIMELMQAARLLRDRGLDIEFLVVGDETQSSRGLKARLLRTLGLRQNMRAEVEAFVEVHSLHDTVHLTGFTEGISRAYAHMDVLCFPSHLDAPGRPVLEAALLGVPSIVATRNPMPDTLIDGETGIAIEARSATHLAAAIEALATDRERSRRMGASARRLAEQNFDAQRNAQALLQLYRRVVRP